MMLSSIHFLWAATSVKMTYLFRSQSSPKRETDTIPVSTKLPSWYAYSPPPESPRQGPKSNELNKKSL